ncbi:hypothetical protein LPJ78_003491 [Coemansia sp. RSA 989]|nr:hypothetical protein LPJ68_001338 [Coemansia sp. RSA 1086]KAJ1751174.1 hypothetical protein LPJ79_002286 [Coemansia sp. RSA 1821]KAJ1864262.1 hypothetical protein LPJ78_003491 [Coemansia sp. RSA 989]KAJ1871823.1 hypothetical protein LPJ55_003583 [Coemansia sp. RSA 990]KAJ2676291.1 hypothetical protein IWW42_000579 [Coemansia sp. RSA 1085]
MTVEEKFEFTQPTQPFEESTQPTQASQEEEAMLMAGKQPIGKLLWRGKHDLMDVDLFLNQSMSVGRRTTCDIQIEDGHVSSHHCNISASHDLETGEYIVTCTDLSTHGTYLNGTNIGKGNTAKLTHGDVLELKSHHYITYLQKMRKPYRNNGLETKYQVLKNEKLGNGTFAEVYRAYDKKTQKQLAVKIMSKHFFSHNGTANGGTNYMREISLLRSIRHKNIVRIYDVEEGAMEVYIFMSLLSGGDLFDRISTQGALDEDEAKFITYQVLGALKCLHDANIVHRDIKPENTLLVSKKPYSQVMLTDFGMAKAMGQKKILTTMCGTFQYIAPEMLNSKTNPGQALEEGYTAKVDCWSLGVMVYAMVSCSHPFSAGEDNDIRQLIAQIKSGTLDFSDPIWKQLSSDCRSFITHLLKLDPNERMSVKQAFEHPWIAKDRAKLEALCKKHCVDNVDSTSEKRPGEASIASAASVQTLGSAAENSSAIPMGPPPKRQR